MDLRLHNGNFDYDHEAGGLDADAVLAFDLFAKDVPWESLHAAQRAFDEAPHEILDREEIEVVLRWRSAGVQALSRSRRSPSARIASHRLRAEPLERRDVPTPLFAIHFLIASLAPPIAAWENERSPAAVLRQPIFVSIDEVRAAGNRGAASGEARRFSTKAKEANDWAIVELLAASAPASRSLEPLGCCA